MSQYLRRVLAGVTVSWDGLQWFHKADTVVDIVPGSQLEAAYGGAGNLSAVAIPWRDPSRRLGRLWVLAEAACKGCSYVGWQPQDLPVPGHGDLLHCCFGLVVREVGCLVAIAPEACRRINDYAHDSAA